MFNDDYTENSYASGRNYQHDDTERKPITNLSESDDSIGKANIKLIGVGGAGNNTVNRMIDAGITCTDYVVVNTDCQILRMSKCANRIQIGTKLTRGLGAGADPEVGRQAAEENKDDLLAAIEGTHLLFIAAGMGGGTGTGAAPVIAKIAREHKILTVAVVTQPFSFEGAVRAENARKGIDNLKKYVDTLVLIPNDKISSITNSQTALTDSFAYADAVLMQGIKSISEIITNPQLINVDLEDVRKVLKDKGIAHMGVGVASGDNRIIDAVRLAVNSPLIEQTIEGARCVLINVVGGSDLTLDEINKASTLVKDVVDASANIIVGTRIDPDVHEEVEVTIIATDFSGYKRPPQMQQAQAQPQQPGIGQFPAGYGMPPVPPAGMPRDMGQGYPGPAAAAQRPDGNTVIQRPWSTQGQQPQQPTAYTQPQRNATPGQPSGMNQQTYNANAQRQPQPPYGGQNAGYPQAPYATYPGNMPQQPQYGMPQGSQQPQYGMPQGTQQPQTYSAGAVYQQNGQYAGQQGQIRRDTYPQQQPYAGTGFYPQGTQAGTGSVPADSGNMSYQEPTKEMNEKEPLFSRRLRNHGKS